MDIKLNAYGKGKIQEILGDNPVPSDGIISIWNGVTYLYDTQIQVSEDMIEEIINGN